MEEGDPRVARSFLDKTTQLKIMVPGPKAKLGKGDPLFSGKKLVDFLVL